MYISLFIKQVFVACDMFNIFLGIMTVVVNNTKSLCLWSL